MADGSQDHVTVVPTGTVRVEGVNELLMTLMVVLGDGAAAAVALKVRGEPVRDAAVAVIVTGPSAGPRVTVTGDTPELLVEITAADTLAPVAFQVTSIPATPLPN
jgi:hypothetical protein